MTRRSLLLSLAAREYFPPADEAGGWRTSAKYAGIDTSTLDQAFEYLKTTTKHGGLLVARRGWLAYERYFGCGHREATPNLASCGKSFTSIAAGILLHRFPRGLRQQVFTREYMPEAFPLDDSRKTRIELGQLLAMSAGIRGNNPCYVAGKPVTIDPPGPDGWQAMVDENALRTGLWCAPGGGYSYATASIHLVSMVLRRISAMELQQFIGEKVAHPLGWGRWGWGYRRPEVTHTPGGGGIAARPTDMLRFAYMLLREGRWNGKQIVPADYVRRCGRRSPFNPHFPYSLQFDIGSGGAYWKTGSGGHCVFIVPRLDLVAFKLGGRDEQYSPANTGITPPYEYDGSREGWSVTSTGDQYARTLEWLVRAAR